MGREQVTLTVTATVSRHNSDEDKTDDALWDEFCAAVKALADDPKYESISPMMF